MARVIGLPADPGRAGTWRYVSGSPSDDSATLTDTNFPATPDATTGGAIGFFNSETILVAAEYTGGTNPGCSLDMLFRDDDASDGSRWKRAGSPVALTADFQEVKVFGARVFPRLQSITGSPTAIRVLVKPGQYQAGKGPQH